MSDVLSKADLLKRAVDTEDVEIEGLDGKVRIRPLTDGEYAQIERLQVEGLSLDADVDDTIADLGDDADVVDVAKSFRGKFSLDLGASVAADARCNHLAAAFGLSCDGAKWKPEEVAQLPSGVPAAIARAVYELTGVEAPGVNAAARFRGGTETGSDA